MAKIITLKTNQGVFIKIDDLIVALATAKGPSHVNTINILQLIEQLQVLRDSHDE